MCLRGQLAPLPPAKFSVQHTLAGASRPRPAPQRRAEARISGLGPLVLCPHPHLQRRRLRPGSVLRGTRSLGLGSRVPPQGTGLPTKPPWAWGTLPACGSVPGTGSGHVAGHSPIHCREWPLGPGLPHQMPRRLGAVWSARVEARLTFRALPPEWGYLSEPGPPAHFLPLL